MDRDMDIWRDHQHRNVQVPPRWRGGMALGCAQPGCLFGWCPSRACIGAHCTVNAFSPCGGCQIVDLLMPYAVWETWDLPCREYIGTTGVALRPLPLSEMARVIAFCGVCRSLQRFVAWLPPSVPVPGVVNVLEDTAVQSVMHTTPVTYLLGAALHITHALSRCAGGV